MLPKKYLRIYFWAYHRDSYQNPPRLLGCMIHMLQCERGLRHGCWQQTVCLCRRAQWLHVPAAVHVCGRLAQALSTVGSRLARELALVHDKLSKRHCEARMTSPI